MSVFRVKLQMLPQQGYLDIDPTTGLPFETSIQRTMYVAGPRRIYRKLADGETFTDCNYWKRFAVPQVSADIAFIEVVTDDGSIYSDVEEENTYPRTYSVTVLSTDTFDDNFIDILGDLGGAATFVQLTNQGTSSPDEDVTIELNGSADATFTLAAGDTQVFNGGDLAITALAFDGGASDSTIQVILGVHVQCAS
jgi:hypothetical protein